MSTHTEPHAPAAPSQFEPLLDCNEAAKLIPLHPKTIKLWVRDNHRHGIPGKKIGRQWFFRASELDAWWRSVNSNLPSVREQ